MPMLFFCPTNLPSHHRHLTPAFFDVCRLRTRQTFVESERRNPSRAQHRDRLTPKETGTNKLFRASIQPWRKADVCVSRSTARNWTLKLWPSLPMPHIPPPPHTPQRIWRTSGFKYCHTKTVRFTSSLRRDGCTITEVPVLPATVDSNPLHPRVRTATTTATVRFQWS